MSRRYENSIKLHSCRPRVTRERYSRCQKYILVVKKKFILALGRRKHEKHFLGSYSTRDYRNNSYIFLLSTILFYRLPLCPFQTYTTNFIGALYSSVSRRKVEYLEPWGEGSENRKVIISLSFVTAMPV